jgi:steroid delta-isomerase-like uncharacterized protein
MNRTHQLGRLKMDAQKNIETVKRHIAEVINNSRSELIPEFYALDVEFQDPFTPSKRGQGLDAITGFMVATKEAFPDFTFYVDHIFGDGDTVSWVGRATGTHMKDFPGMPAKGNKIEIPMCQVMRFNEDGKIKTMWVFTDSLLLVQQATA